MEFLKKSVASLLVVCITHNGIAAYYLATGVLFFSPYSAIADAILDSAGQGKALGNDMRNGFSLPDVDADSGRMTLKNGAVAGDKIEQGELFQEIEPGAMDAAVAAYGDNEAMATTVNDNLAVLGSSGTGQGMGYQTLIGANTATPNLKQDPLWQKSDDIFGQKTADISEKFSGCTKNSTVSEQECTIHQEKIRTCKKSAKADVCRVTRNISYAPVIRYKSGDGKAESCGLGCTALYTGRIGDNYWSGNCTVFTWTTLFKIERPEDIRKAVIEKVNYDDRTRLYINNQLVYTGQTGWGGACDLGNSWVETPNTDITNHFKNVNAGDIIEVRQETSVGGNGEGYIKIRLDGAPDVVEQFSDTPIGCRDRVFNSWPPNGNPPNWIVTDSLEDQASTPWWRCTDASTSRTFTGVTIDSNHSETTGILSGILPEPRPSPPAPVCYSAETRPPGHVTLPCFTDVGGYQQCPEYDYNMEAHDSCESFQSNSSCAYIGEQCADGATNPVTGACQEFIVTYDCGTSQTASCGFVKSTDKSICNSDIRCIGGECVDHDAESSKDFTRVAAALQTMNQAQQKNGCDPTLGECKLFEGEAMTCQMADLSILGKVDCCNMPIEGSWIDYLELGYQTWEMADTAVDAYALAEYGNDAVEAFGAWDLTLKGTAFSEPFTLMKDAYTAITQPFTSMFDSVTSMLGEKIGSSIGIDGGFAAIQAQAWNSIGNWVANITTKSVATTLFSTSSTGVYTGLSSMLSSVFTVIGIIYAIYNIAKMVVQLIFACTQEEASLNMMKSQRLCTRPDEIGTYCSAEFLGICLARKEAYCCFSSAFGRIFQQQARPQLGMTFGPPKNPDCSGLTQAQISRLDFDKMDLQEWIGMLQVTGHMPINGAAADVMYDKGEVTKSKLKTDKQKENTQDRLKKQTEGTDIDSIRQHLLNNL